MSASLITSKKVEKAYRSVRITEVENLLKQLFHARLLLASRGLNIYFKFF